MRLGLLLSLVSALQIAQQSVVSELSDFLNETEAAIVAASFPLGKFVATFCLGIFPIRSSRALKIDAWLLIIGSLVSLLPSIVFLAFGRFLIGLGAGLGFVCATVMLYERITYHERPSHFCILGMFFAAATSLVNLLPFVYLDYNVTIYIVSAATGLCGIFYLTFKPDDDLEDVEEGKTYSPAASSCPIILVLSLMIINVTIGVPIIIGFSSKIFESFGISNHSATLLSIIFPVVQICVMLTLYYGCNGLNRRLLIIGGYAVAIFIQFLLLITSSYPYLPEEHHTFFLCSLFFLLTVVTSVPANTALCLIAEQFHDVREQTRQICWGRAIMWALSTVSTASFMWSLHGYGFSVTFLPYFVISCATLAVIVVIYPKH